MPPPSFKDPFSGDVGFSDIGFPWRLFTFSIFLLIFSVFAFLGLKFGYGAYLKAEEDAVEREVQELSQQIGGGEEEGLVDLYSKLVNVKRLLEGHRFPANTFSFLEQYTLLDVRYESMQFDGAGPKIVIAGLAPTAARLAEQLSVFDGAPEVRGVSLSTVRVQDSDVRFGVSLDLKQDFFDMVR